MTEQLKTKRATTKGQFTRSEKRLKDALNDAESIPLTTIKRRYDELNVKWTATQEAHDAYILVLSSENAEAKAEEENWIEDLNVRFDALEIDADRIIEQLEQKNIPVKTEEETLLAMSDTSSAQVAFSSTASMAQAESSRFSSSVQLERIKLEKFNGDVRKYPKFREQFQLYVKPLCKSSQLPFVLRSHLVEDVKEEVDNVDDDLETLWNRLDSKYGNCGKLVDAILTDIARAPKGDGKSTLIMIDTVERAYRDLARMGKEAEMKNGTILAMIEKKLPEEIRFDWVKTIAEKNEEDSDEKFTLLLELLRKWRIMIEYDQATIRRPTEKRSISHMTISTSQGQRNEKNTCWIHTSEKHPIWVCQSFKAKSVVERLAMVKQNKACQACLELNCSGVLNAEKCKKGFKCPVQACGRPHNRLLHQ